jgi:hypothetical protein
MGEPDQQCRDRRDYGHRDEPADRQDTGLQLEGLCGLELGGRGSEIVEELESTDRNQSAAENGEGRRGETVATPPHYRQHSTSEVKEDE